ncbi:sister chromatid cohesion 1 protein 2-like [Humulus lupulus]|uniref:sister chromatid cohesion 1 protein 2-like n=1 Tax=Humulus lupulus TaxID=3486 RepID=UPI002B400AEE|nr:sister chromatid cohesion 1 protein 2-like [Humulus lupulus]XP_062105501.1 sister chromatid cohesion 1 protein 2-like [Humulus lupulus]
MAKLEKKKKQAMFSSQTPLSKSGPLGAIRVAAYCFKRLKKPLIQETDVSSSVDWILQDELQVVTYRVLGYLLLGIVRIYSKKVEYLFDDCQEVLIRINDFVVRTKKCTPENVQRTPCFSITLPESFALDAFNIEILDDTVGGNVLPQEKITLKDSLLENAGIRQYALDMHLSEETARSHNSYVAEYTPAEDVLSSFRMNVHLRKSRIIDNFTTSMEKLQENRFSQEECMDFEMFYAAEEESRNAVKLIEEDHREEIIDLGTSPSKDAMHGKASSEKLEGFGEDDVNLVRFCEIGEYAVNIALSYQDGELGETSIEKLLDFGENDVNFGRSSGIERDYEVTIASLSQDAVHGETSTEKLQDFGENAVRSCGAEGDYGVNIASSFQDAMHGETSTEKLIFEENVNLVRTYGIEGNGDVNIASTSKDAMRGGISTENLHEFEENDVDHVRLCGLERDHGENAASSSKDAMHGEGSTEKLMESGDNGVVLVRSGSIEGESTDHVAQHGEDLQIGGQGEMVSESDQPEGVTCQIIRQAPSPINLEAEMEKLRNSTYAQVESMDLDMFSGSNKPQECDEAFTEENHNDEEQTLTEMLEKIKSQSIREGSSTATKLSRTPKIKVPVDSGASMPQFTLIPTPAAKDRARITRKRKCVIDDTMVLPNAVLKKGIVDASDLVSKRIKVAHSAISVWKAKYSQILHHNFFEPLLPCVSSELRSLFSEKKLKIVDYAKSVEPRKELNISEIPPFYLSNPEQIGIAPETPVQRARLTNSLKCPLSPVTPNDHRISREPLTKSIESPLSPGTPKYDRERSEALEEGRLEPFPFGDQELPCPLENQEQPCPLGDQELPPRPLGDRELPYPSGDRELPPCPLGDQELPPCPLGDQELPCPSGDQELPPCPLGDQELPRPYGDQELPPCPLGDQELPRPLGDQELPPCPLGDQELPCPSGDQELPPCPLGDEEHDLNLIDEVTNSCGDNNNELHGWSGRTRTVAEYLHRSFLNQQKGGKEEVVNLSRVVKGRTKKESARFFYEILVLNTKGYVNVKQDGAYSDILVRKPQTWPKLVEQIMFNKTN